MANNILSSLPLKEMATAGLGGLAGYAMEKKGIPVDPAVKYLEGKTSEKKELEKEKRKEGRELSKEKRAEKRQTDKEGRAERREINKEERDEKRRKEKTREMRAYDLKKMDMKARAKIINGVATDVRNSVDTILDWMEDADFIRNDRERNIAKRFFEKSGVHTDDDLKSFAENMAFFKNAGAKPSSEMEKYAGNLEQFKGMNLKNLPPEVLSRISGKLDATMPQGGVGNPQDMAMQAAETSGAITPELQPYVNAERAGQFDQRQSLMKEIDDMKRKFQMQENFNPKVAREKKKAERSEMMKDLKQFKDAESIDGIKANPVFNHWDSKLREEGNAIFIGKTIGGFTFSILPAEVVDKKGGLMGGGLPQDSPDIKKQMDALLP